MDDLFSNPIVRETLMLFGALAFIWLCAFSLKGAAKRTQKKHGLQLTRYIALKRSIFMSANILSLLAIILIFGISVKNLWASLTSIIAVIAITFFAIWSLVGNVLAGLILYFTTPFKINDWIRVEPEKISGRVLSINTFFTLLQDTEGNFVNIPNSLFFQKYVYKMARNGQPDIGANNG
jgi:MscS family membrane protein